MNIIPKISTASCECENPGFRLVKQQFCADPEVQRVEAQTGRVVTVNRHAYRLLEAAGITPPDEPGQMMDVVALDKKLLESGLGVTERMQLKAHLRDARLLQPGKHVDMSRR